MGFHIDPMAEAAKQDCMANAARHFAADSRWRIVKWWYERKARKYETSADVWRGLEWRRARGAEAFAQEIREERPPAPPAPPASEDPSKVVKSG